LYTFQSYDLVDITRQCLQLIFDDIYKSLITAYKMENLTEFDTWTKLVIVTLDEMDRILSSNEHFLLGKWIENAKSLAVSDEVILVLLVNRILF
jgi:alpha-N-acetylglucosaminidase